MTTPILHHYDMSPYAEKARLMMGIKGLAWNSVDIPFVMPKPDLMPLTGGYRRTPVMQIGADIYCDTRLIATELERRYAGPTLMTGGIGLANFVSGLAENSLFWAIAGFVVGRNADKFPVAFHEDRARLRGASGVNLDKLKAAAAIQEEQLKPQLAWAADLLGDREWLAGDRPGLVDLVFHHPIWFLNNGGQAGKGLLSPHPNLLAYLDRVATIGHGTRQDISAGEALAIARNAEPEPATGVADNAEGWKAGDTVAISPTDYGRDPVSGSLITYNADEIAITRTDPAVGTVAVHFPRVGFGIRRVG